MARKVANGLRSADGCGDRVDTVRAADHAGTQKSCERTEDFANDRLAQLVFERMKEKLTKKWKVRSSGPRFSQETQGDFVIDVLTCVVHRFCRSGHPTVILSPLFGSYWDSAGYVGSGRVGL
jgi:hypothetical protein